MSTTQTNPAIEPPHDDDDALHERDSVAVVTDEVTGADEAGAFSSEEIFYPSRRGVPGRPPWAARQRLRGIRWKPLVIGVVLAGVALGAYAGLHRFGASPAKPDMELFAVSRRSFPVILQEKGELKAANSIDIRSELEGKATIIFLAPEGTSVKKGDPLVELASDEINEKIRDGEIKEATAKAALEAAQRELEILIDKNKSEIRKADLAKTLAENARDKYDKGEAVQLKQADDLALKKAQYVLQRAQARLKDSEELYKQNYITRIQLETDRFEEYQAKLELEKAKLALQVTETYTIPMAMKEKESDVEEAVKDLERTKKAAKASEDKAQAEVKAKESELAITQEKLAKLREQKAKARILAPAEGLVVYARDNDWGGSDVQIKLGATVHERQPLIELPDTSKMKVAIRVHEAKTERLKLGLPATVEIEGFSGQQFTGKVSKIAVLADSRSRWINPNLREYETEILLDGEFTKLKPGNTARAQILVTELKDVLAVPVQAVFGKGNKYYVFVDDGNGVQPVEVKIGLASTEFVEIRQGLTEGQKVRLAVSDEMKLKLPQEEGNGDEWSRPNRRLPRPNRDPASQPASQPASRPAA